MLTRDIASHYHQAKLVFYPREGILRLATTRSLTNSEFLEMTALEVHNTFGGSVIEEVREYGSASVAPAQ